MAKTGYGIEMPEAQQVAMVQNVEAVFQQEHRMCRSQGKNDDEFLDMLNEKYPIGDHAIVNVTDMSFKFAAAYSSRRCERYLMVKSKLPTIDKWVLAKKHNMERLMITCVQEASLAEEKRLALYQRLKKEGKIPWLLKKEKKEKKEIDIEHPVTVTKLD